MLKTQGRVLRWGLVGVLALSAALVLLSSSGCFEPSTEPGSSSTTTSASSSSTIPTLTEIQGSMNLSAEQLAALQSAHERWQQAEAARLGASAPTGQPPMIEFVAECASVLDRGQLVQVIRTLGQVRKGRWAGPGGGERPGPGGPPGPGAPPDSIGGPGRHPGPGPGGDPFAGLGLSDAQRAALGEAMQTLHTTMRSLHEQLAAGELTQEQFEQAAAAARATFDASVRSILTPEQYAQLQQVERERMIEHLQARLASFDDWVARRLDMLDRILGLDDQQVTDIRAILVAEKSVLETIIARLQSAELTAADARAALEQQHRETEAAIRAVLTDEQRAILDALESLRPPGGGPHP